MFHQTKKASSFIYHKVKDELSDKSVQATKADESSTVETIQEAILIDDSSEILEETVSPEDLTSTQPVFDAQLEREGVLPVEELIKEQVENPEESSDTVISLEKLLVPTDVPPIEENLGMGDRDHDDMYSTRSSRS